MTKKKKLLGESHPITNNLSDAYNEALIRSGRERNIREGVYIHTYRRFQMAISLKLLAQLKMNDFQISSNVFDQSFTSDYTI